MRYRICVLLLLVSSIGFSQVDKKYWLFLKAEEDKFTVNATLPFSSEGYYSEWIHAISVQLNPEEHQLAKSSPLIDYITPVNQLEILQIDNAKRFGFALEQIKAEALIKEGLNGNGVKIGIIDGGFLEADQHPSLIKYFKDSLVNEYRDYLTPEAEPYSGNQYLDDQHGTDVWEMVGGYNRTKDVQLGIATHSEIYLARTDHGGTERRIEEDYFIQALEWMDSCGVKLINASVGYTYGYNNPNENYTPKQMDGSSAIAKAVQYAAEKKGMLIVVAAGNEGDVKQWQIINTPADAKDVLAVGASKLSIADRMKYSSIGPDFLSYLKPEVSCFASRGTSFSTPVITGLAAAIWQYDGTLSNLEVKDIIIKSGNLYPYGNNHIGYGIPNSERILDRLKNGVFIENKIQVLKPDINKVKLDVDFGEYTIVAYHKINDWYVIDKELFEFKGDKIRIKRFPTSESTTVIAGENVWEIQWSKN